MRTLFEILEAARHGQKPSHDECYYVMLMQSALHAMDRQAIRTLLHERVRSKISNPAVRQAIELVNNNIFDRNKKALNADPQKWLGNNVPGNPGYDRFLRMSEGLVDKLAKGQLVSPDVSKPKFHPSVCLFCDLLEHKLEEGEIPGVGCRFCHLCHCSSSHQPLGGPGCVCMKKNISPRVVNLSLDDADSRESLED